MSRHPSSAALAPSGVALIALAWAATASVATAQDAKPIATAKAMVEGVRIEVEELKRKSDGTLMLKFAVVNDSARDWDATLIGPGGAYLNEVHLVDLVNRKQYEVGRKSAIDTLSSGFPGVKGGGRTELWAIFAAPPPAVAKLTLMLPHFYPVDDVPIGN